VHHAAFVRGDQRVGERDRHVEHLGERQAAGAHEAREVAALDQLHGEEARAARFLDRVQNHDVGMIEAGHRLGLALESREPFRRRRHGGRQHLDRDVTPEARVACAIDLAHAARPEGAQDLVRTEVSPAGDGHRGNLPHRAPSTSEPDQRRK
jgi:hypothetical protein